ncbi:hypothetical protein KSB_10430 [Ktedonobacter robiniae]|uniref:Bacterial transcriptional activator domain-containing protein n=1 Tax=Ktedonobacter robiniae TaxID=2778365 RepID=A0ABQ3UIN4_9CHLR|nr:hypothetical protein KSB_10430 [Ktedonobacter robiniae]
MYRLWMRTLIHQAFQQVGAYPFGHATLMTQAQVGVEALTLKAQKNIIDSLVGKGRQQDALSLLRQALDNLGNNAGLPCSWGPWTSR